MDKTFKEISEMSKEFDLDSEDPVISQTRFIFNMILGLGPADMMSREGQMNFLYKCENNLLGKNDARVQASRVVYEMLFAEFRGMS